MPDGMCSPAIKDENNREESVRCTNMSLNGC